MQADRYRTWYCRIGKSVKIGGWERYSSKVPPTACRDVRRFWWVILLDFNRTIFD